jgi:hypothetical protein
MTTHSAGSDAGINYSLVLETILFSGAPADALRAFVEQEREDADHKARQSIYADLTRPPCWGPNERGELMVDISVDAYEADLRKITRVYPPEQGTP